MANVSEAKGRSVIVHRLDAPSIHHSDLIWPCTMVYLCHSAVTLATQWRPNWCFWCYGNVFQLILRSISDCVAPFLFHIRERKMKCRFKWTRGPITPVAIMSDYGVEVCIGSLVTQKEDHRLEQKQNLVLKHSPQMVACSINHKRPFHYTVSSIIWAKLIVTYTY